MISVNTLINFLWLRTKNDENFDLIRLTLIKTNINFVLELSLKHEIHIMIKTQDQIYTIVIMYNRKILVQSSTEVAINY